jgi:hypothetical protein
VAKQQRRPPARYQPEVLARAIVETERWFFLRKTAIPHGMSVNLKLYEKDKNTFTSLDENAQPRLDTHQKGRGTTGRE